MKKQLRAVLLILCMLPLACGYQTKTEPPESSLMDSCLASDQASSALDAPSLSPTPEQELPERERLWIADISYLREQYKHTHVEPFYYCSEEEFDWKLDQVATKKQKITGKKGIDIRAAKCYTISGRKLGV